jgi:hypothetical protein
MTRHPARLLVSGPTRKIWLSVCVNPHPAGLGQQKYGARAKPDECDSNGLTNQTRSTIGW